MSVGEIEIEPRSDTDDNVKQSDSDKSEFPERAPRRDPRPGLGRDAVDDSTCDYVLEEVEDCRCYLQRYDHHANSKWKDMGIAQVVGKDQAEQGKSSGIDEEKCEVPFEALMHFTFCVLPILEFRCRIRICLQDL